MRRLRTVAATLALGTALSGCWLQSGYDAGWSNWNPQETTITAANAAQLEEVWSYQLAGGGSVHELLSDGNQVFGLIGLGNSVRGVGLGLGTGEHRWTFDPGTDVLYPLTLTKPVYVDGHLVAAYNNIDIRTFQLSEGGRVVIDPATGQLVEFTDDAGVGVLSQLAVHGSLVRVGAQRVDWECDVTRPSAASPFAFVGLTVAAATGSQAHGYRDCDPTTGVWGSIWTTDLGGTASAVAAVGGSDAAVYLDSNGRLSLLDAAIGAIVWTAETGGATGLTVADGRIIVRDTTGDRLLAYAADTGTLLWEAPYIADDTRLPIAGGDVVYMPVLTANQWHVVAFDLDDGTQLAGLPVGSTAGEQITAGPIVAGGRLVVGTSSARVVAFGLPG